MRVKAGTVLAVGLIAVGLATALYPFASQWISQSGQQQLIYAQQQLAGQDTLEQQMQLAQDYNQRLYQSSVYVRDPFEEQAVQELPQDYEQQLNVLGDGVMGYLQIPAIDLQLPIYHGVTEEVLQKGVGHLPESSLPTGGENTHCVLSAHAGLNDQKLFTDLELLELGDRFTLYILGEQLTYEVDSIQTVLPDQLQSLSIQPGEDLVTLMTCTPYGINTHRLLVRGHRVEDGNTYPESPQTPARLLVRGHRVEDVQAAAASAAVDTAEGSRWMREYRWVLGGVILLAAAAGVGMIWHRKRG